MPSNLLIRKEAGNCRGFSGFVSNFRKKQTTTEEIYKDMHVHTVIF
jgi:hypothetical protein